METKATAMHELTLGALEGLEGQAFSDMDAQALALSLTVIGDAVRLGLLPPSISQRAGREITQTQVEAVFVELASEVASWALPRRVSETEDDPTLEWTLGRRDEIESVITGARRVFLPRGVLIDRSKSLQSLFAALKLKDLTCGGQLRRSDAERLLGARCELLGDDSWLEDLEWAAEPVDTSEPAGLTDAERAMVGQGAPTLEAMVAFVTDGELASWVLGAANRSSQVAEELADVIATYREHGHVGLAARRWERVHKAQGGAVSAPRAVVYARPSLPEKLAASSSEELPAEDVETIELGKLAPVDAVARFSLTNSAITLQVFVDEVGLRELSFAGVAGSREDAQTWSVTVPWVTSDRRSASLRVVDERGQAFEVDISWSDA
jgi:hypothetical protein